ncbi:hypothetical protein [Streptomyces sp. NPDC048106]|uniref:hypothetical protein n=1 Tax=Streptomyces sp. NPDC048106 TaxID=3155750 RepID=UPI00345195EB
MVQQALPVKREFIVDGLAIASLNVHREYFGKGCAITLSSNKRPAQTSCVAFGLERWLAVLDRRHNGDWDRINAVLEDTCQEMTRVA